MLGLSHMKRRPKHVAAKARDAIAFVLRAFMWCKLRSTPDSFPAISKTPQPPFPSLMRENSESMPSVSGPN